MHPTFIGDLSPSVLGPGGALLPIRHIAVATNAETAPLEGEPGGGWWGRCRINLMRCCQAVLPFTASVVGLVVIFVVLGNLVIAGVVLVIAVVCSSCYADRLRPCIRIWIGVAVIGGGAAAGYFLCPFPYWFNRSDTKAFRVDRIASTLALPFVLATLTGVPRVRGESWRRCIGFLRCYLHPRWRSALLAALVGASFFGLAAALGFARRGKAADALRWGVVATFTLVVHVIFNSIRDSAEATPRPPLLPSSAELQSIVERQTAASKLPLAELTEKDMEIAQGVPRCSVCLEAFVVGDIQRVLPCFHMFHPGCVDVWIGDKGRCPVCRHSISENDISDTFDREQ